MELRLTKDLFENNIYTQILETNSVFIANSVQEHIAFGDADSEVNTINLQIFQDVGSIRYYAVLPNIIGMSDKYISISSDYPELLGSPLTVDNIDKCVINVSNSIIKGA